MSKIDAIKHHLHDVIDQIDDESVLTQILGQVSSEVNKESAAFWDDLNPEEKAEIMEAYEESKDPANLVSHEEVKRNYEQWLTK